MSKASTGTLGKDEVAVKGTEGEKFQDLYNSI
jgi:hypothetical protein